MVEKRGESNGKRNNYLHGGVGSGVGAAVLGFSVGGGAFVVCPGGNVIGLPVGTGPPCCMKS